MFGRSKLETKTRASLEREPRRRSRRASADRRWRSARCAARRESARAAPTAAGTPGRKSWPHCDTQCASSIANSAIVDALEQLEAARRQQPLGRDVEQVELAGAQRALDVRALRRASSVELRNAARTPSCVQRRDLVLHQRDQRRDHDADARRAAAPGSGSTATCRRRSASAPARRRRRRRGRRSPPARRETRDSRTWRGGRREGGGVGHAGERRPKARERLTRKACGA